MQEPSEKLTFASLAGFLCTLTKKTTKSSYIIPSLQIHLQPKQFTASHILHEAYIL